MKLTAVAAAAAVVLGAARAGATEDVDLRDTWRNALPTNRLAGAAGDVTWLSLTFAADGAVKWEWIRGGSTEAHSGRFRLEAQTVPKGARARWDIVITPSTLAVAGPIILRDATVQNDNRFPALWTVLKCFDDAGNQDTFVRQSVYDEWREFRDLLEKAERAEQAEKARKARPSR